MTPIEILHLARQQAGNQKWTESEMLYKELISVLEKNDESDENKIELWSVIAEYLQSKPWFYDKETREEFRIRILNSIRYIYKCTKFNEECGKRFQPFLNQTIKSLILTIGCIVHENETHVIEMCPILIRQNEFGKRGSSIGGFYKKAICSICKLDILNDRCIHEPGTNYGGEVCMIEPQDFQFLHLLSTPKPKDPRCVAQMICYPKSQYYTRFDKEILKLKKEQNAPMGCTFCKSTNHDPSEISPEQFFEMQGLHIDFDKKFELHPFEMKPDGLYISYPIWFGSDKNPNNLSF